MSEYFQKAHKLACAQIDLEVNRHVKGLNDGINIVEVQHVQRHMLSEAFLFFFLQYNLHPSSEPAIFYKRLTSSGSSSMLHCVCSCIINRGQCRSSYRCRPFLSRDSHRRCVLSDTKGVRWHRFTYIRGAFTHNLAVSFCLSVCALKISVDFFIGRRKNPFVCILRKYKIYLLL